MKTTKNKPRPRYTGSYWTTCQFCAYLIKSTGLNGHCLFLKRPIKSMDCTRCSSWKEKTNKE